MLWIGKCKEVHELPHVSLSWLGRTGFVSIQSVQCDVRHGGQEAFMNSLVSQDTKELQSLRWDGDRPMVC